jgi:hypothetical protein
MVQELVRGILDAQKARMTLQLALFAAAVTLTAAAFQYRNAVLFVLAAAVVPLAWLSDHITKRNTLSPLLYKLARLEIDAGDTEPLALLFAASNQRGFDRFRSFLDGGPDGESRRRFRRHFLMRDLAFRVPFYGVLFAAELVLAYVFRDWMPAIPVGGIWPHVTGLLG